MQKIDGKLVKKGMFILADSWHPEITRGGKGVALVTDEGNGTNFLSIEWIKSSVNPHAPCDLASVTHFIDQFSVLSEEEVKQYVPEGWKPQGLLQLKRLQRLFKI